MNAGWGIDSNYDALFAALNATNHNPNVIANQNCFFDFSRQAQHNTPP
jgi:hypothetical protein